MIKEKLKNIISFNGLALIIGILGSLASILTVFITKWDSQISLKWLVFILFISITVILILIKLSVDLNIEIRIKKANSFSILRYIPDTTTFLIRYNDILGYSAMVSIFYQDDSYEVEFAKGYVSNIQEQFIQIKLLDISYDFKSKYSDALVKIDNNDINILKKLIVKSYITYTK